ncbi:hypothetical protein G6M84_10370 [Agrobacterium tumefaciens]|uniref:type VI secretion system-associated protein TagO n=1 Tax=Agrobacterium tumefaciens TaxID=358 RepID=UPI001573CE59|nr:type VI secretion system-associated protein TagO [Agrobacterium tumefaciens]NTB96921.1 hypothetical protein [Agrobacterium tumefaciens]NTC44165.1 hypothetical protein [Agrobacterium tumefaciens]
MRNFVWIAMALATSLGGSASASGCVDVTSDLDRLACYDKESGRTPTPSSLSSMSTNWEAEEETSKLSDKKSVFLNTRSVEDINCGWNKGAKIWLSLRCHENTTAVIFRTGCHMTSSEYNSYGDIQYRVDAEKSKTLSATESTDNRALGLWSGGKAIPFIKEMIGKEKLVVKMTPYGENPFTATFNIGDLDTVLGPLRKECGW